MGSGQSHGFLSALLRVAKARHSPLAGQATNVWCASADLDGTNGLARGFSLIEMLVALVVLSLSLGVLYQSATGAIRNVRVAEEYTEAIMLAESLLADHSHIFEENYSAAGSFEQYVWRVTAWPSEPEPDMQPDGQLQPRTLEYLQVIVEWDAGASQREVELTTVVPLMEPAS
jgi:general secretion pathway protein I